MTFRNHAALPNRREIRVVPDAESLARAAVDLFVEATTEAVANRGHAYVALSGGTTPRQMGQFLREPEHRDRVPWDRLDLFWGDERWVPQSSPESNAGVARRTFLDEVPIPVDAIHPFPTEIDDPAGAAREYEQTIRKVIGGQGVPRFDLVLLGMGDDGHTASLFPGTAALAEREALAVANHVPKLDAWRLTLTVPAINAARTVAFLITGSGKAATLAAVLEGDRQSDQLPSQLIQPANGPLLWLIDQDAAADLRDTADSSHG